MPYLYRLRLLLYSLMADIETTLTNSTIIAQTQNWINSVVIGCNFCPFASKAMLKESIRYIVLGDATMESSLDSLADELRFLKESKDIETTFVILPDNFSDLDVYLDLVALAEGVVSSKSWKGIFQIAGFHPDYCFTDADSDDPANFTNRSMYPMLHILREDGITKAIENFPNPDSIPERNIAYSQNKGFEYMKLLRAACFDE